MRGDEYRAMKARHQRPDDYDYVCYRDEVHVERDLPQPSARRLRIAGWLRRLAYRLDGDR